MVCSDKQTGGHSHSRAMSATRKSTRKMTSSATFLIFTMCQSYFGSHDPHGIDELNIALSGLHGLAGAEKSKKRQFLGCDRQATSAEGDCARSTCSVTFAAF